MVGDESIVSWPHQNAVPLINKSMAYKKAITQSLHHITIPGQLSVHWLINQIPCRWKQWPLRWWHLLSQQTALEELRLKNALFQTIDAPLTARPEVIISHLHAGLLPGYWSAFMCYQWLNVNTYMSESLSALNSIIFNVFSSSDCITGSLFLITFRLKHNPGYLIFPTPIFPECHWNFPQLIYLMKSALDILFLQNQWR